MIEKIKRVLVVTVLMGLTLLLFVSGVYELMASPLQLVMLKTLLVTSGLLLAHVARKALFPKLDLSSDDNWQHFLIVLGFYLSIPYFFSIGG